MFKYIVFRNLERRVLVLGKGFIHAAVSAFCLSVKFCVLYMCSSVCSSLKMARKRLHVNVVWCGCVTVVQFSSRFSISLLKSKQSTPNLWSSITSTATLSCAAVGLVHCCPCTLSLYTSFSFFFSVCVLSLTDCVLNVLPRQPETQMSGRSGSTH